MTKKTDLVSTSTQPVRHVEMSQALRQYLDGLNQGALLTPADEADSWRAVERGMEMHAGGSIIMGYHLKRLRAELGPRNFSEGLAQLQLARRTAYEAIEVYELFDSMPEISAVRACAQMGSKKALQLADLSKPELHGLLGGQEVRGLTLDQVTEMSVRDLDTHLRDWKREHDQELKRAQSDLERTRARAELAEAQLDQAKADLANRARLSEQPEWYRVAQAETPALTEGMAIYLADLVRVIHDHVLTAPRKQANDKAMARMAASRCYLGLAGVVAEAQLAMQELVDAFGAEAITGEQQVAVAALSKDELMALAEQRVRMLDMAAAQRETREAVIKADQPRGRGRPKGSKNKPKAGKAKR